MKDLFVGRERQDVDAVPREASWVFQASSGPGNIGPR